MAEVKKEKSGGNPMLGVRVEKVTLNIGVGEGGDKLQNAKLLLERLSGAKAVLTKAHNRAPEFKIRQGDPIGTKVTLRHAAAVEFLRNALDAVDFRILPRSIDSSGNVSFGVKEYIDFPNAKYDPKIGMLGFDVCVTLSKPGRKVALRKIRRGKLGIRQRVSAQEAKAFMESLGANLSEEESEE
ncbi:50S ribosomal protein L5 [Candidatus Micrarchaeota archaeon]|nr:50S ribosomal protein L5 [Candidatus Micrarchaeota archaeon]MBI5177365.1 50S ribosomal protein L5 [Candidatus Micrarchaeota archaeon]